MAACCAPGMRYLHLCAVVLAPTLLAQLAAQPRLAPIPAGDLFRPPAARSARLNPAGTHVAMVVYTKDTDATGILVYEIETGKTTGLKGSKVYDVRDYAWVSNDRLVFNVARNNR